MKAIHLLNESRTTTIQTAAKANGTALVTVSCSRSLLHTRRLCLVPRRVEDVAVAVLCVVERREITADIINQTVGFMAGW